MTALGSYTTCLSVLINGPFYAQFFIVFQNSKKDHKIFEEYEFVVYFM